MTPKRGLYLDKISSYKFSKTPLKFCIYIRHGRLFLKRPRLCLKKKAKFWAFLVCFWIRSCHLVFFLPHKNRARMSELALRPQKYINCPTTWNRFRLSTTNLTLSVKSTMRPTASPESIPENVNAAKVEQHIRQISESLVPMFALGRLNSREATLINT